MDGLGGQDGVGNLYIGNFDNDKYHSGPENDDRGTFGTETNMDICMPSVYLWCTDGDVYRGSFSEGVQNGFGEMINVTEQSRYIGYFEDGARSGIGYHEKQGNFYLGQYQEDQSHGVGIY